MTGPLPLVIFEQRGRIAVLTLNRPPVNAIGAELRSALAAGLDDALGRPEIAAIVLAGTGKHFSAGADIHEFGHPRDERVPSLDRLGELVESAPKPVVAAIQGTATGGALELALACAYRVGTSEAVMGLPEVTLGFVPGAGGTVRLPRLVGVEKALDMILTGRRIGAAEAVSSGLLDEVVPGTDLVGRAVALAERVSALPPRRTRDLPMMPVPAEVFTRAEAAVEKMGRGRRAPAAALDCVRRAATLPFDEAIQQERQTFLALVRGPESAALRHAFFAERAAQKVPWRGESASASEVRRVGVVGVGTMGTGIAVSFAAAGYPVIVIDQTREAVDRGLAQVRTICEQSRVKGRISDQECADRIERVRGDVDYDALADADLVIEAAFEELDVKLAVFAALDKVCREDAILATNTSSLDVNRIAAAIRNPARVLGLHFFSPAEVMKLVEVIRPDSVSPGVLATALEVVRRLGKVGVLVGVGEGFVGNRMLFAYRRQADFLLEEGAMPHQVDAALHEFGMAMGPFQAADMAGLDISWRIRKRLAATRPGHLRYSPIADRLCEMGRLGQKTGAGWYRYEQGSRTPIPDPEVEGLVRAVSADQGFARREITHAEILERCLGALINEGAAILEEGLAARPGDIDVIWIHGYGFPRHRGGPMHWANTFGLRRILDSVERMHVDQGALVQPSRLLGRLVRDGQDVDTLGDRFASGKHR